MAKQTIQVPDIGGSENVDVIEVCVAPGDVIAVEESLLVLESDKASMDVPSPVAGTVISVLINEGDTVSEGDNIVEIETDAAGSAEQAPAEEPAPAAAAPAPVAEPAPAAAPAAAAGGEETIQVPDIGGSEGVDIIEVCVEVGDEVSEGDSLIVLESDKASMEVPAPVSGKVTKLIVAEGGKVSMGDDILVMAVAGSSAPAPAAEAPAPAAAAAPAPSAEPAPAPAAAGGVIEVAVPDIGGSDGVDVIEVCVAVGEEIVEGESMIVLESDKASMEVPAPQTGKVIEMLIAEGDKASEGTPVMKLEVAGAPAALAAPAASAPAAAPAPAASKPAAQVASAPVAEAPVSSDKVYAGPAVRQLARQLGVELDNVKPSGPRGRIQKDDVRNYVKSIMTKKASAPAAAVTGGSGIPPIPAVDFSQFGETEMVKMSKIAKLTAANMSRNWLNVPHVTQFDDADISDLEDFRKGMKAEAEKKGVKLTPLPFLLKACAAALQANPKFNVSLHSDGEHIVQKKYVHIGVAVDTPNGLMVPVIRDVDKKGLFELAAESVALAGKARDGKLMPRDMQGGCFTISSLGPIGGTGFTPIVNAPEVAILGVSKAAIKPVWNGSDFVPRQMLPLALSYDHRAINGADAGKFFTYLGAVLADVRKLLL